MALRLPSLTSIYDELVRIARRFPLAVVFVLAATVAAQLLVGSDFERDSFQLLLTVMVGFPLAIALPLLRERGQNVTANAFLHLPFAGFLLWFFLAWPEWTDEASFRHLFQLKLFSLLTVAGLVYWNKRELRGFWQFNRNLLLRFLLSSLFAVILFGGISVLIAAFDQLFGVDVDEDVYLRLWFFVVTFFHPLYVMAGIPSDLRALDGVRDYAAAMRILGQYILMPLVAAYLLLLLAYFVKILITTQWPSGAIGWLVSAAGVVGMFSLLLLHPLAEERGGEWIARYRRAYYAGMIPALGMMLAALYKRIGQYGWTENRYFLIVLALWLLALCVAHFALRWRDIRWIPLSLAAVALLTSFGPWSAYSVGLRSQMNRLLSTLDQSGLLHDGRARPAETEPNFEARRELSALTTYLISNHGLESLRDVFADQWAEIEADSTLTESNLRYLGGTAAAGVLRTIDVAYVSRWQTAADSSFYFFANRKSEVLDISDYDIAWGYQLSSGAELKLPHGERNWVLSGKEALDLTLSDPNGLRSSAPLDSIMELLRQSASPSERPLLFPVESGGLRWLLEIEHANGNRRSGSYHFTTMSGRVYAADTTQQN